MNSGVLSASVQEFFEGPGIVGCGISSFWSTATKASWPLTDWPLSEPRSWTDLVNQPQTETEVHATGRSILCAAAPTETATGRNARAASLGLESTLRPHGRPKAVEK